MVRPERFELPAYCFGGLPAQEINKLGRVAWGDNEQHSCGFCRGSVWSNVTPCHSLWFGPGHKFRHSSLSNRLDGRVPPRGGPRVPRCFLRSQREHATKHEFRLFLGHLNSENTSENFSPFLAFLAPFLTSRREMCGQSSGFRIGPLPFVSGKLGFLGPRLHVFYSSFSRPEYKDFGSWIAPLCVCLCCRYNRWQRGQGGRSAA